MALRRKLAEIMLRLEKKISFLNGGMKNRGELDGEMHISLCGY
jgi:hypothetical protein